MTFVEMLNIQHLCNSKPREDDLIWQRKKYKNKFGKRLT